MSLLTVNTANGAIRGFLSLFTSGNLLWATISEVAMPLPVIIIYGGVLVSIGVFSGWAHIIIQRANANHRNAESDAIRQETRRTNVQHALDMQQFELDLQYKALYIENERKKMESGTILKLPPPKSFNDENSKGTTSN